MKLNDQAVTTPPRAAATVVLLRDAADAFVAARAHRPPLIQPEPFRHEGMRAVAFPGDARHPVFEPVLPGPSFLVYRNQRLEPWDGFEALFV